MKIKFPLRFFLLKKRILYMHHLIQMDKKYPA